MSEICKCCGAKIVQYKHSLNSKIVAPLWFISENGGEIDFKELAKKFSFNDVSNFQKLKYWELIDKVKEDGHRVGGKWRLTKKGYDFINGKISLNKSVYTFRNVPTEYLGKKITILDLKPEAYREKDDYVGDQKEMKL